MNWCFREQCRLGWGLSWRWLLLGVVAAAGCAQGHEAGGPDIGDEESGLAALMADGELPAGMYSPAQPPATPLPPPRFCSSGPFPGDSDAGVDDPGGFAGTGGFPVPVPRPPPLPVAGSFGIAGSPGMGAAGAGSAGGRGPAPVPSVDLSCASEPVGFWQFDFCDSFRTDLFDSSNQGHTAFRSVDVACVPGWSGQGVQLAATEDIVYAPDQQDFALGAGLTIGAWVKPDALDRTTRTLFRKRDGADSAFAVVLNNKRFQFIVRLSTGKLASVSAPAKAGVWQHVTGTYDGSYVRLYLNGSEVASASAPGQLSRGAGPLLMGNDGAGRRFQGRLDEVWFNTLAAPASKIAQLTCRRQDLIASVSPMASPAVQPGTPVDFVLTVENPNEARCGSESFFLQAFPDQGGFTVAPEFFDTLTLAGGESLTQTFTVTSPEDIEPGSYPISFNSFTNGPFGRGGGPVFISASGSTSVSVGAAGAVAPPPPTSTPTPGKPPQMPAEPQPEPVPPVFTGSFFIQAQYVVAEPTGCHVSSARALTIRDVSVVDDTLRTTFVESPTDPRQGAWSFGRLMQRLSRTDDDAADVTESMLRSFLTPQTVNSFEIPARPPMDPMVLAPWPRTANGKLDLAQAPMRLLAITNRLDLKDLAKGKAGEGRLVYGVLSQGFSLEFTVIFEYLLPANSEEEFAEWASAFHALQELPFPSEEYNQALQDLTDLFTARGFTPDRPNGSALIDVRTNEFSFGIQIGQPWQLREFRIGAESGFLDPAPVALTPDPSFNFGDKLARFINENEATILTETHDVPLLFEEEPFVGSFSFNNIDFWTAPGINNPEARHKFSLNTCNGCHGGETQTSFLHVFPREVGQQSQLSGFLTGETVFDPETGQERRLAELARRRQLMEKIVCAGED